ncbi:hypothetical protein OSB04_017261 [Centaurea solstitialis]|uniref:Tf2-1-like SH3-like domain-containing protein n=1 Tax=Centaurea solstitialis TaxID=347529 RepID=A0AA38TFR2_9ASTR|nr:hypothetical protein OSB04_017261 [Centaurea solstitialis]
MRGAASDFRRRDRSLYRSSTAVISAPGGYGFLFHSQFMVRLWSRPSVALWLPPFATTYDSVVRLVRRATTTLVVLAGACVGSYRRHHQCWWRGLVLRRLFRLPPPNWWRGLVVFGNRSGHHHHTGGVAWWPANSSRDRHGVIREILYGRKCRTPLCWNEVGEKQLAGPEIVQITSDKINQVRERLKTARDGQKSYADRRRKDIEFQVGDRVMLKVSPWKGVIHLGRKGKLSPRFIGPFRVTERIGAVAYRLELPVELSGVHNTFHVSNLRKCLAEPGMAIPLEDIEVDQKLNFVEEPIVVLDRKIRKLRSKEILLVKVQWKFHKGQEATWEVESEKRAKYPFLFRD